MPNKGCTQEWMQEIVLLVDNELSKERCHATQSHIGQCRECEVYYHSVLREDRLLAGRVQHECAPLPDSFTNTIMDGIESQTIPSYMQVSYNYLHNAYAYLKAEGKWHVAVGVTILVCFIATYMSFQVGNAADRYYVPMMRNGEAFTAILPQKFDIDAENGEFFTFPDNTIVYATPGTRFVLQEYPKQIGDAPFDAERELELQWGHLYLDVAPADQGFTVITSNAETKVFGTQFYVSTSKGIIKQSTVAVHEGIVMVEKRNNQGYTKLTDNRMTQVNGTANTMTMRTPYTVPGPLKVNFKAFNDAIRLDAHETPQTGIPSIKLNTPSEVIRVD